MMTLRVNKKYRNNVSLSEPVGTDKEGNELTLIDLISLDDDSVIADVENRLLIEKVMELIKSVLDTREYEIIKLRYGLNNSAALTQREVADKFGISRSYISRIEKKAVQKIRAAVNENDIVF